MKDKTFKWKRKSFFNYDLDKRIELADRYQEKKTIKIKKEKLDTFEEEIDQVCFCTDFHLVCNLLIPFLLFAFQNIF